MERATFKERKSRKIQELKKHRSKESRAQEDEKDPFEALGTHARVKTVAVGGVTTEVLAHVKAKVQEIGKVLGVLS